MNPDPEALIHRHLDGQLTREEAAHLRHLLLESAEARGAFCSQALVDGRLHWEFAANSAAPSMQVRPHRRGFRQMLTAAALLLLGTTGAFLWHAWRDPWSSQTLADSSRLADSSVSQPVRSIARIGLTEGASWNNSGTLNSLPVGTWLSPGVIDLAEGSATLFFDAGARLTMTAPCRIDLIDPMCARLLAGTVSADVPSSAIGFKIDTPKGSITDLSTRFGVSVSNDANEVQVFEGEVIVRYGKGLATNKLIGEKTGIALRSASDGIRAVPVEYRPELFPSASMTSHPLHEPDRPIGCLHWSFDTMSPDRSFPSSGTLPGAEDFPARLRGSRSAETDPRIPGPFGNAIHLNGDGTFLETLFPGVTGAGARTIAFWLRIPPVVSPANAYSIIGWGHPDSGEMSQKWEIGWNTGKFPKPGTGQPGAIRTDFGLGHTIGSTDLRDGRWHHVVSVFTGGRDADAGIHIRHYVDGHLEGYSAFRQQSINTVTASGKAISAVIGRYLDTRNARFSSFHGSIDELYVFNASLTPAQILQLRDANSPPTAFELLPTP